MVGMVITVRGEISLTDEHNVEIHGRVIVPYNFVKVPGFTYAMTAGTISHFPAADSYVHDQEHSLAECQCDLTSARTKGKLQSLRVSSVGGSDPVNSAWLIALCAFRGPCILTVQSPTL